MHKQFEARITQGHAWRIMAAALFALALVVLWRGQPAFAAELAAPAAQGVPTGDGGDDNGGDNGDDIKAYGLLTVWPQGVMTGTWVIGGVAYTATESTEFFTLHGGFEPNKCVEVEVTAANPTVAKEIGTEEPEKCSGQPDDNGGNDDGNDDDGGEHHGDDDSERYGRIDSLPASGLVTGTWVISGVAYTVTDATELDTEYGGFDEEVCVKVHVDADSPTVATEIESKPAYKCNAPTGDDGQGDGNGDDHHGEGKLYGVVEQLPVGGLIGLWVVSGKNISVTEQTDLHAEGVFTVGVTVKVEFVGTLDETLIAKEIELKFGRHDHEDDDHDDEGQAYGIVVSRPPSGTVGVWVIAGVEYTVTEGTNFRHDEDPQTGAVVKVKYFVQSDGSRIAKKIHLEDGQGRLDNPNMNKLVGIVDSKPLTGFVGTWVIAGADFEADLATRFKEDDGLLMADAYVEVLYVIENNVRRIVKIETHVPPGAGDDDSVGEVESVDDSRASVAAVAANSLVVDGVAYSVTPATQIVDDNGEIAVGATVSINSYMTTNGQNVATRVTSLTLDNKLVLPFTQR